MNTQKRSRNPVTLVSPWGSREGQGSETIAILHTETENEKPFRIEFSGESLEWLIQWVKCVETARNIS